MVVVARRFPKVEGSRRNVLLSDLCLQVLERFHSLCTGFFPSPLNLGSHTGAITADFALVSAYSHSNYS